MVFSYSALIECVNAKSLEPKLDLWNQQMRLRFNNLKAKDYDKQKSTELREMMCVQRLCGH